MRKFLVLGFAIVLRAQEFEAASVKPAAPPTMGMMRIGMRGGPGSSDPTRIEYNNSSLKDIMTTAYDVKRMQIVGPDWLDSQRFDVTATMAPGTTKEQFHLMLQKLLADRFGLTLHRDKKEMAAFTLAVGKKGPKMKQSTEPPPSKNDEKKPDQQVPPPPPPPGGRGPMQMGKDGFPMMPGGPRAGMPMIMMMPGKAKLTAAGTTMDQFVAQLERFLNKPVADQTGLKGKYDFELIFQPDPSMFGGGRGMMMAGPPPGGGGGPEMKADDTEASPLPLALQEQLGLKLDATKTQVDIIVVDHMEKVPTEN